MINVDETDAGEAVLNRFKDILIIRMMENILEVDVDKTMV